MDADVSFGFWLQKRRKALDLTREELAQKVGCSASAVRKIEMDVRHPSKQLAELLACALDIPAETRSTFIKIARGELSIGRVTSSTSVPDISLLLPSQTIPNPVPIPTTPLLGRENELAALRQMLINPECRLITLVGLGGIGKTRLAVEVARNQSNTFAHGTVFVSLASVNSANLIVPSIARALILKLDGSSDPYRQLLNYLREKQILLILDNLEHLLDGVGIVSEIIEYAPGVKILCTSREQLNLYGEWIFEVRGLRPPQSVECTEFDNNSAVRLFLQRARQVTAGLSLKNEDRAAIVQICNLVDGMPLAIELSAVWTRILSFQEIALEIEKSLDFLSTNLRDIPERHRSLRAVFDQSWRLLTRDERDALMKLSVFQGGFTRELAEQVANANLDVLSSLITKSLIQRTDEERYNLHEAVRQYGLIQLEMANQGVQTRAAHMQAFIHLAEMIEPELTLSEQDRWLAYLEIEHDNFRAALHWAFDSGDAESSLRLCSALWRFWHLRSHFVEGSQWLERALQAGDSSASAALRAEVLHGAGYLAYYQNRFDQSIHWLEECIAMQSQVNEGTIAHAQATLALVIQELHDFARAWSLYEEAIERFRRLKDDYGMFRALNNQGILAFEMNDLDTASRLFGEVLILARRRNDKYNIATVLTNLGWAAAIQSDTKAIDLCREAIVMFYNMGSKLGVAFCLEGIGAGFTLAGKSHQAVQLFGAASAVRESIAALSSGANLRYLKIMLQRACNALSDTAFASAWTEGKGMTMEQAIELARTI